MATIQEALRAAHGQKRVTDAKAAELHALLTDLNYHTEAALLEARQHGMVRVVEQLERIAALRNERGSLRGLADDGTPLAVKRDALIAEIEAHKARWAIARGAGHRTSNPGGLVWEFDGETVNPTALIAENPGWYELKPAVAYLTEKASKPGFRWCSVIFEGGYELIARSPSVLRPTKSDLAGRIYADDLPAYFEDDREGNPRGHRTENPPKKPVTVRFKPAELKAIAEQRGATYFVAALEYAETSGPGASPGWRMGGFLARCASYWQGLPAFQDAQVDIEPLGFDKNKLAKSLSVTARVNTDDAAAVSDFTDRYVPIIVNGWIDGAEVLERGRAELKAISRTGNPRRR